MVSPAGTVRQLGRILYWLLCCLLVLAVTLTAVAVVTAKRSLPDRTGTVDVPGLRADVHVQRDAYGIPQVTASSSADLFFAQGWVHAQDRFWEMDFRRHLSAGRLAELFGASVVETDMYLRTMGWHRVAAQEYALLDQRTRDALDDYARGVNAYLADHHGAALGLEYSLLRLQNGPYRPERWTPIDSLAWLKVMAWQLRSNDAEEQLRAVLSNSLSPAQVADLFPPYPYDTHRPIVQGGKVVRGTFHPTDEQRPAGRPPIDRQVGTPHPQTTTEPSPPGHPTATNGPHPPPGPKHPTEPRNGAVGTATAGPTAAIGPSAVRSTVLAGSRGSGAVNVAVHPATAPGLTPANVPPTAGSTVASSQGAAAEPPAFGPGVGARSGGPGAAGSGPSGRVGSIAGSGAAAGPGAAAEPAVGSGEKAAADASAAAGAGGVTGATGGTGLAVGAAAGSGGESNAVSLAGTGAGDDTRPGAGTGAAAGAGRVAGGREVAGVYRDHGVRASLAGAGAALRAVGSVAGAGGDGIGSNAWAVAGSRTASGRPILANDPHLAPAIPSIWYQLGLRCAPVTAACPYDVSGFTFSGFPGVIIGHNSKVAWGFTNLGPDVVDLYLEKVRGDRYEYRGEQLPLSVRTETIRVAGGKPVTLTVRATRHGPILSGVSGDVRDAGERDHVRYAVAMRWTALTPGHTADAVLAMNTASDFTEFRAAAKSFEVPAQNLVYADVAGHIGYQAPGKVPVRTGFDGKLPALGWTGEQEWTGYVPYAALPYALDPAEGYVVTANQAVAGETYPYHLTSDWDYGYRSQRIVDMITSARRPLTVADTGRAQLDTRNAAAAMLVPYLRTVDAPAGAEPAKRLFDGWDYSTPANSAPAAYFNAVWRHLLARTFDDQLPGQARPDGGDRWFAVVGELVRSPESSWWDDARTPGVRETRDDILAQAMGDAYDELATTLGTDPSRWHWGDLHTLTVRSQSFGESGIAAVEAVFNRGPLALGGGTSVVDATGWSAPDGYEVNWLPSMRMVVDLSDLDRSRWVNLTGASGHPFDRHYFDQAETWASGGTTPMRWEQGSIDRGTIYELVLRPDN